MVTKGTYVPLDVDDLTTSLCLAAWKRQSDVFLVTSRAVRGRRSTAEFASRQIDSVHAEAKRKSGVVA